MRFGLVGTGLAGPLFAGALASHPAGASLVAVASRRAGPLQEFADRYAIPDRYKDWRDLVKSPTIDAVCIATPTGFHMEIAEAAASHGKHVLTEKPIAANLADADQMIAACADQGVTLGVIFMYRFMDTARAMKSAIDNGHIGTPILAECSGKFFRSQAYYDSGSWRGTWEGEGGGALMTQTSHTLDLMLWMLGDVDAVSGFYDITAHHRIETEDVAVGILRFRSGTLATVVSSSAITPPVDRSITIHGTEGTIRLEGDDITQWDVPGDGRQLPPELFGRRSDSRGDTRGAAGYADSELHRRQIEDFVTAIQAGRRPAVDGIEGRKTLEVMKALYRAQDEQISIRLGELTGKDGAA
jgi:predicted dehydrogenase